MLIRFPTALTLVTFAWLSAGVAIAQPVPSKDPSSTHIFPAGARRGTTVDVRVGGECLAPGMGFRIWGEGVKAPALLGPKLKPRSEPSPRRLPTEIPVSYAKEWQSRIEIAADAPLGVCYWRLTGSRGGTGARAFVIGDLPEFIESEPNSVPAHAESVVLPCTINGQIAGERDVDYYRFSAIEGDIVTCDVAAARLGSPLEVIVEVRDGLGRRLPLDEERHGCDPVVAMRAPATGEYLILIGNLSHRGGPDMVYRMSVSTSVCPLFALPSGGTLGEARQINFYSLSGQAGLDVSAATVLFTGPKPGLFEWRLDPASIAVPLVITESAEMLENEPNDQLVAALDLPIPSTVTGQFGNASDEDWYQFAARQGQALSIDCRSFPSISPALPILELEALDGAMLARASSVEAADRVCRLDWKAPADGVYRLRLRDLRQGNRGGPEFVYRLSLVADVPDFTLQLASDVVNLLPDTRVELGYSIRRSAAFAGPIELQVAGLPPGVVVEGAQIPADQASGKLTFIAAKDARPGDASLSIVGRSSVADVPLCRTALAPHLAVDAEGVGLGPRMIEHVQLTVQHPPVFRLYCAEAYQYAHRGTVYPYLMEVERLAGFDGPVTLQLADRQNRDIDGVDFFEIVVPPGETQVKLPIYLPETMHINVQSQSQVYAQAHAQFTDQWGQEQSQLIVSEKRCMLRTLPTVARLRASQRETAVARGKEVVCQLELDRTPNFTGALVIELVEPTADSGWTAEPAVIAAGENAVTVSVRSREGLNVPATLRFRGQGEMPGGARVISEAVVQVVDPGP